jgi:hypothetical protein
MDEVINRFAREGSMRLSDFIRELRGADFNMFRGEVVAELSRRGFTLSQIAGQTWIVGLSPRSSGSSALRQFIDGHCIRADGLQVKLAAIVRGSGLPRTQVIHQLQQWGFEIQKDGAFVVRGLGLKEPVYA